MCENVPTSIFTLKLVFVCDFGIESTIELNFKFCKHVRTVKGNAVEQDFCEWCNCFSLGSIRLLK